MSADDHAIFKWEVIKNDLWFAVFPKYYKVPAPTSGRMFLNVDEEIIYENFYYDFGPHHLNNLARFCRILGDCRNLFKVTFYTVNDNQLILNALYLLGGYLMIHENKKADWFMVNLKNLDTSKKKFRTISYADASIVGYRHIQLSDVLKGLEKAITYCFFNFDDYNDIEYAYHEKVVNGDLNWILPGKLLAFSGPHSNPHNEDGYNCHTPSHYHFYFRETNVTTIVRLNTKNYDASLFTLYGFEHFDLYFEDGSPPSHDIMYEFIKICEQAKGGVAVHCKAGLGRTGTLIACYIMKHYNFTAKEAIAWLRICRPGSVIAGQVTFLQQVQKELLNQGQVYRQRHGITRIPKCKYGIYSIKARKLKEKNIEIPADAENDENDNDDDKFISDNEAAEILNTSSKNNKGKISTPSQESKIYFVSLDSIIKCNSSTIKTRSSTRDKKNKISFPMSKPVTNNTNKKHYPETSMTTRLRTADMALIKSSDSNKNEITKVSPAKIISVTTRLKASEAVIKSSANNPTKSSLAKCRIIKKEQDNVNNNSCRVTRQNNENISLSAMTVSDRKKNKKKENDNNALLTVDLFNRSSSDFDSTRDSTSTILTNISADSLENIPCKISVTCSEPMDDDSPNISYSEGNANEDGNSQGNRLYQIKALRRKLPQVSNSNSKGRIQTRSVSNSQPVKKK